MKKNENYKIRKKIKENNLEADNHQNKENYLLQKETYHFSADIFIQQ